MKKLVLSSLLFFSFALPAQAQQDMSDICGQHQTIYDAKTGFCVYPDRPDVFTTTGTNVLIDIRQDLAGPSYMVQAYNMTTDTLVLAVVLDDRKHPENFLIGDSTTVEQYRDTIDTGLLLLENWQP
jgi:hypothetical protein